MTEYTGQCCGGPDNGNLITSTVKNVWFKVTFEYWLDGPKMQVTRTPITGAYVWDEQAKVFRWELDR